MSTRSVLVHLPGFPLTPVHLMPQREMARAASALLENGHWARVVDYGTVTAVERFGVGSAALRLGHLLETLSGFAPLDFVVFHVHTRFDLHEALKAGRRLRRASHPPKLLLSGPFAGGFTGASLRFAEVFDGAIASDAPSVLRALTADNDTRGDWLRVAGLASRAGRRIHQARARAHDARSEVLPCYDPSVYLGMGDEEKLLMFSVGADDRLARTDDMRLAWQTGHLDAEDARRIRREMDQVATMYGGAAFHVGGFAYSSSAQDRLARELVEHGCNHPFSIHCQPRAGAPGTYRLMRNAGCAFVRFEVRTGSQILQDDFYRSGIGMSCVENAFEACRDADLPVHAGLVYPCPLDDRHTFEETLRFLRRCRPATASMELPQLLEESAWWQDPAAYGFRTSQRVVLRWLQRSTRHPDGLPDMASPYRMRGWAPRRIMEARTRLVQGMGRLGVASCSEVYVALAARVSGHAGDEEAYDTILAGLLRNADGPALRSFVREFNASVARSTRGLGYTAFRPVLEAVGN